MPKTNRPFGVEVHSVGPTETAIRTNELGRILKRISKDSDFEEVYKAQVEETAGPMVSPMPSEGFLSVQDAAIRLGRSEGYLYRLIREGRLCAERQERILKLPVIEVNRVSEIFAMRKAICQEKQRLKASGKSSEASRKAIFRKHRGSPKV